MPFDLYGSRPRSSDGRHCRYTLGAWHPLWGYCELIAPDLIPADNLDHVNDGWGLEGADALKLADRLAGELESGETRRYQQARRAWYESLPTDSFGGIHIHHAAQRDAVGRAAGIAQSHQGHRDAVSAYDTALPPIDNSPAPSTVRDDVRSRGIEIKQQTEGAREKFDQEAQIVETDDGTLASRKSLGIQSGKQVLEDSLIMYEETSDTTKSLYQRAKDAIKKKLDDE